MTAVIPRRAIVGWVLFDWAAQPFFTLIITFVYAPYFASAIAPDPVRGQALWGFATAAAGFTVALLSPVLGSIADASGRRKPWIAAFGVLVVVGSSLLWLGRPGDASVIPLVLDGLRDRRRRRRVRRRVHQRDDAVAGAAGAARPALRHRLGRRLCRRAVDADPGARLPRRQSADRQDAARHDAAVRARSGAARRRPRGRAAERGVVRGVHPAAVPVHARPPRRPCRSRAAVSHGLRDARRDAAAAARSTATSRCSCWRK